MWYTMVTLIPMVLEVTIVLLNIMEKSDYILTRYFDPIMVSSNTMGFRVTLVDHMSPCSHGLRSFCHAMASKG